MAQSALIRLEIAGHIREAMALLETQRPLNDTERRALYDLTDLAEAFELSAEQLTRRSMQGDWGKLYGGKE